MDSLRTFIDQARAQGWDDSRIRQALSTNGWSNDQIEVALSNLVVPKPLHEHKKVESTHDKVGRPSITALQAALQHVLLWLFTFTSSIMVSVVSFALFAAGEGSSGALLTYLVLELVTFIPFALLYYQYARKLKSQPELMTGRAWSIITVVLHTIGLISAVISFILVLILVHNSYTAAGLISSGVVGLMNILVVLAYVLANFAKSPKSILRRRYLQLFPLLLFVLIAALGVVALLRVGPLRADDQTKQNLSDAVSQIHDYSTTHHELPTSLGQLNGVPSTVSYRQTSQYSFTVCANLKKAHSGFDDYGARTAQDDAYVGSGNFSSDHAGQNCYKFKDYDLATSQGVNPYNVEDTTNTDSRTRTD